MNALIKALGTTRPPFLILTPACILLGISTAMLSGHSINTLNTILIVLGGLLAHISVNMFNEYYDAKSGLDEITERTPFSGGSGTLQAHPELSPLVFTLALLSLFFTSLIGLYFLYISGTALLPLGILGIIIVFSYTTWITRHPLLCLFAPGLAFGPVMVMGTHFVLAQEYSVTAFIASLVPFFLVNNLLLLNQFPDVEADRSVGRKHIPMILGTKKSSLIYSAMLIFAYTSLLIGVILNYLPSTSLLGLVTLALAIPAMLNAYRHAEDIKKLLPTMSLNVAITIMTPTLIAIGIFI